MNGFILHLQAPMMSFGDTGFGQLRDAGEAPSRSTVLGIVGAAMGLERGDAELLRLHSGLRVHVAAAYSGARLVDYQTVVADGYDEPDPALLRRNGARGANPVLTWRSYHLDAHFVALVTAADAGLLHDCRSALGQPVFTAYIGRRSCPPATPLLPSEPKADTIGGALEAAITDARKKRNKVWVRRRNRAEQEFHAWLDGDAQSVEPEENRTDLVRGERRDLLVQMPRSYVNRPVLHVLYRMTNPGNHPPTTEDFFHAAP